MSFWGVLFVVGGCTGELSLSMGSAMCGCSWRTQSCRKEVAFVGIARKGVSIDSDLSCLLATVEQLGRIKIETNKIRLLKV